MKTKTQDSKWIQLGKKFAEEQTLKNLRNKNYSWSNLLENAEEKVNVHNPLANNCEKKDKNRK